ncbi:hypothetical protein [Bacillus solimangrovi]|uniref:Uncharacterized protein n=1 Tax=Bacillus solimangrovi TaxID=1305675 RepID=A0A1E5LHS4_9BACI|nr:hypothetical protein [Bacillus solimangrovi]OEH93639.1 hypothetical protein BFG57_01235 [Bacillus solimangrovi]
MKKVMFLLLSIILLVITGCNNNIDQLSKENEQLKLENQELNSKNLKLLSENKEKDSKIQELHTELEIKEIKSKILIEKQLEEHNRIIEELTALVDTELTEKYGIFNRETINSGDKVSGLTVIDVKKEKQDTGNTNYFVNFNGQFELKGSVYYSQLHDDYIFRVNTDSTNKIPHTLYNILAFRIENEDRLKKALGNKIDNLDKLEKLGPEENVSKLESEVPIKAVFEDFSYVYIPESDAISSAKFVKVIN